MGFALLGLLARQELTGYEISARMRAPIGYFWSARHSQIYPGLQRLEADGLVRATVITGPGPRPTRRYRITDEGRAALRKWVTSPVRLQPARSEFRLRVYCLWLVEPGAGRTLVEGYRSQHATLLDEYEREEEGWRPTPQPGSPEFASYATARAGLSYERQVVAYCDWLLEALG